MTPAELIRTYIRAKDDNRPYLMRRAFAESAELEMVNLTSAVEFPPITRGLGAITETFIRRFNQTYENVITLCLSAPPKETATQFSCDWLLGMSEKDGGALRSGCGRYDWSFQPGVGGLVERLKITIELMPPVPAAQFDPVLDWLAALPYPWCSHQDALRAPPSLEALGPILTHLRDRAASPRADVEE